MRMYTSIVKRVFMQFKNDCIRKISALSDETRLSIIDILMRESSSVNSISKKLGLKQYNVSKHLRILENVGLISKTKNGQKRIYSLQEDILKNIVHNKNKLALPCCSFDFTKLTLNAKGVINEK